MSASVFGLTAADATWVRCLFSMSCYVLELGLERLRQFGFYLQPGEHCHLVCGWNMACLKRSEDRTAAGQHRMDYVTRGLATLQLSGSCSGLTMRTAYPTYTANATLRSLTMASGNG